MTPAAPTSAGTATPAWTPAHSVTTLLDAITGALDDTDTVCTVHGGPADLDQEAVDHDQDDDPEGLEAQYADAIRA